MFDSKYYKGRYAYRLEGSDYKAMIEMNTRRNECYVYVPDAEKPGDYAIYLRKLNKNPLDSERIESLGELLESHGFTDLDFANPFGRTKKIVNTLDVINQLKQDKTKAK